MHENGWVEAGKRRTETFRPARNGRFHARLCVDMRPKARVTLAPGAKAHVKILADADDRASVSVTGSVVGADDPTQIPVGIPISLIGAPNGVILPPVCLTSPC